MECFPSAADRPGNQAPLSATPPGCRGSVFRTGGVAGGRLRPTKINGIAENASLRKKARQQKPTFSEFIELAKRAISTTPSVAGLRSIQKLLKTGVTAKSSPILLIEELFTLLKDWPECSRLALQLSVRTRSKQPTDLIRGLRNRLIAHSRAIAGYPEPPKSSVADHEQLAEALNAWLKRRQTNDPGAGKEGKASPADLNWARWAAVCLMEEPLVVRTEGIYRLLETHCPKHPVLGPEEAEIVFFSEIGSLLGVDKLNAGRIAAGLKLAAGARTLGAATRGSLRAARETLGKQNARLDETEGVVKSLRGALADATARIADLEAQLLQKAEQIEQQKTERNLDREHLEVLAEQRLTRMMNDFAGRLAHEIGEARICLDGDEPNVSMTLDRLRQMERILAKMRST
jgi:hypothetical protein